MRQLQREGSQAAVSQNGAFVGKDSQWEDKADE